MSFGEEDNGKRKKEGSAVVKGAGEFLQKLLLIIASRKKKSPLDKFSFLEKSLNFTHPFYSHFAFQHR